MGHHDRPRDVISGSPPHRGVADEGVKHKQRLYRDFAGLIDTF